MSSHFASCPQMAGPDNHVLHGDSSRLAETSRHRRVAGLAFIVGLDADEAETRNNNVMMMIAFI